MVQRACTLIADAGPLHVLIYSAGVKSSSYVLMANQKQVTNMLGTDLVGAFLVTRHAVRLMKRNAFGRVIYVSSVMVRLGHAGSVIYGVGKAGLEQMAFALSQEFPKDNITFNALGLSIFPSPMTAAVDEKVLNQTRAGLVKQRDLELDEVVGAIDFFASDAARQVTGQTLYFGGVR